MGLKDNLGESYRKSESGDRKTGYAGSRAYRRFFEGYEEITVPGKNGKGNRIERIYRGLWYREDVTNGGWICRKAGYSISFLASLCLFLFAAVPYSGASPAWYTALFQAVSTALYFWLFCVLCSYVVSPRNMTVSKYKRACRPLRYAAGSTSAAVLLTAVCSVIYSVLHGNSSNGNPMTAAVLEFSAALLVFLIFLIEKKTAYITVENSAEDVQNNPQAEKNSEGK